MRRICLVVAPFALLACGPEPLPAIPDAPGPNVKEVTLAEVGLDAAAMDRTVDPCDDFYKFACGGWEKATEIPSDKPRWNRSFSEIHLRNINDLRDILESAAAGGTEPAAQKLGDYYAGCMDEDAIEAAGMRGISGLFSTAGRVKGLVKDEASDAKKPNNPSAPKKPAAGTGGTKEGTAKADKDKPADVARRPAAMAPTIEQALASLHERGVYAFFDIDSGQDFKDATKMIADRGSERARPA